MASFEVDYGYLTCRLHENMAIIQVNYGTRKIYTSVGSKEKVISLLNGIMQSKEVDGILVLCSDAYAGHEDYKQILMESLNKEAHSNQSISTTYRSALGQLLEKVYSMPMPVVMGLNGDIGPDSFGLSLAFDLRISSSSAVVFNQNIQLGFPSSALLSFYLAQALGSPKATELILTKTEFSAEELLNLGLISKIVPPQDLETACLNELRKLTKIPGPVILETRNTLKPDLDIIMTCLKKGIEGSLRTIYSTKA